MQSGSGVLVTSPKHMCHQKAMKMRGDNAEDVKQQQTTMENSKGRSEWQQNAGGSGAPNGRQIELSVINCCFLQESGRVSRSDKSCRL